MDALDPAARAAIRLRGARICLIVTEAACRGPWERAVERALASGAIGIVQLREKGVPDRELVRRAGRLRSLARESGALVILNDRADLVVEADADGAHVGEHDLSPLDARALLGPDRIVGVSTHDAREVAAAREAGADYAGLGPCFPTTTKALSRAPGGPALVRSGLAVAGVPLFPIGGIAPENVGALAEAGALRVAVGAGILAAEDPARAAEAIYAALRIDAPAPVDMEDGIPVYGAAGPASAYRRRPGVYGVVIDAGDRVAVLRTPRGVFLPGGGADPGETIERTLARESLEESGHAIFVGRPLGTAIERIDEGGGAPGVAKIGTYVEARLGARVADPIETDHEFVRLPLRAAIASLTMRSQAAIVARAFEGT